MRKCKSVANKKEEKNGCTCKITFNGLKQFVWRNQGTDPNPNVAKAGGFQKRPANKGSFGSD